MHRINLLELLRCFWCWRSLRTWKLTDSPELSSARTAIGNPGARQFWLQEAPRSMAGGTVRSWLRKLALGSSQLLQISPTLQEALSRALCWFGAPQTRGMPQSGAGCWCWGEGGAKPQPEGQGGIFFPQEIQVFSLTGALPKRAAEARLLFVLSNHFTNISKALCNWNSVKLLLPTLSINH